MTRVAVAFVCLTLIGCAGVPVESLKTFADAFQQARNAGDLLLDEISPIVSGVTAKTSASQTCQTTRLGFPACFDPRQALGAEGLRANEDISIKARRNALATVATFNSILVDLAEGKSVDAVGGRVEELAGFAGVLAELGSFANAALPALVGPAGVFVRDLAVRLEEARSNARVRQAILASKDDIKALLGLLASDTPHLYEVFKRAREKDLININRDRNVARLSKDAAGVARAAARYEATRESISAFHASLTAYVQLLDQTSKALDSLVEAAEQSPGTLASLNLLVVEAVEIKEKSEEFWETIRKVRAAAAAAQR